MWEQIRAVAWILVGNLLAALAVNLFILPAGLPMTGVTGLSLLLYRLFSLPVSLSVLLWNLLFLLLGYLLFGRRFFFSTLLSSFLYPVVLSLFSGLFRPELTQDPLLSLLFGGGLLGIGIGLVMRVGASTGGIDVLQLFLSRRLRLPMAAAVLVTDAVILLLLSFSYSVTELLYGILLVGVEALLLERTLLFGAERLKLEAVTTRPREVSAALMAATGRGATLLLSFGGYTEKEQRLVFSVVSLREATLARRAIFDADPAAFLMILAVREVDGKGFRTDEKPQE